MGGNTAKYSISIYKNKLDIETTQKILQYLKNGITVFLFIKETINKQNLIQELQSAINNYFLVIIQINNTLFEEGIKTLDYKIIDTEFYNKICQDKENEFNNQQFGIVHSKVDANILIRAGAGTGKTTAMINRILFLKHINKYFKLNEVVLITFTNEATIQMRERLIKRIEDYYNLTKNNMYLKWLDEVANMRIQTIHSFARDVLERHGEHLGFYDNFKITTFKYKRYRLIEKYIEEFKNSQDGKIYCTFETIPQYELIKKIVAVIEKLDNFAVDTNSINYNVNFGLDDLGFSKMLEYIIKNVTNELEEIKKETNSWEINDLIKKLPNLEFKSGHNLDFKILMVDEFQDTDKTQVDFISWIIEHSNSRIFVVGDEKQSIYRFRGADYTAFEQLKEKFKEISVEELNEFSLVRNYRTNRSLLSNIDEWFVNIGNKVDRFNYNEIDRIYSLKNNDLENEIEIKNLEISQSRIDLIKEVLLNKKQDEELCILVRRNSDVDEIKQLCDENRVPCEVTSTGDFFRSEPVRNLYIMIKSLINKNDNRVIYSLLNTSYCKESIDKINLLKNISFDDYTMSNYLKEYMQKIGWNKYIDKSIVESPISLIEEIIKEVKPEVQYFKKQLGKFTKEDAKVMATEYKMNLDHCIFLIRKNFSGNIATLNSIENYLRINIQTNDVESMKKISDSFKKSFVKCMTIHKAKGLEFDYVIVPETTHEFISNKRDIEVIVNRDEFENINIAYKLVLGNDIKTVSNNLFKDLNYDEKQEIIGEETRLFYVALTRAKKELYVHKKSITSSYVNSWMTLIPEEEYNV
ncbi:UvrD-helicase domain-containing protein [Romboutsia lituseburensis]|uniref:UvrD-helicase domain-containing protein n=1 Tax=Romboutsia lituseburensis TaxID=1537 RepID=UPI00215B1976|nr:ATP-dependent helicase [Romboutsia lituseburensis]MCR8743909.1 ATP-dependent helicase [Romboutsia lituseburensis]